MKRLAVILALSLVASNALAHGTSAADWPREQLGTYTSEQGESLDDFALRLAPTLAAYTARTDWEACGVFGVGESGTFAVALISVQASLACVLDPSTVPAGFVATGESIHSHPTGKDVKPSEMDHVVAASAGYKLPNVVRNGGGQGFSPSDMAAGPGYVVVKGGRVLHQRGPRTVRRVK